MRLVSVMYAALSTALLSLLLVSTAVSPVAVQAEEPVVHAVMFWMDGCSHCHDVLDNVLPQLQQQYGRQFDIHLVEVNTAEEFDRLLSIAEAAGIPPSQVGVPFLLIGDAVLIGAGQIPAELPGLIETYLAAGGVAYPDSPGLESLLPQAPACPLAAPCSGAPPFPPSADTATSPAIAPATPETVLAESLATTAEPAATTTEPATATAASGFVLAIAILAGLVVALAYGGVKLALARHGRIWLPHPRWMETAVPILAVVGLGVAAYLAYVETQAVTAVCGPSATATPCKPASTLLYSASPSACWASLAIWPSCSPGCGDSGRPTGGFPWYCWV